MSAHCFFRNLDQFKIESSRIVPEELCLSFHSSTGDLTLTIWINREAASALRDQLASILEPSQ